MDQQPELNIEKSNKLPKSLTTVTPLSKTLALMLFVALPFIGFYLGIQYQKLINLQTNRSLVKDYKLTTQIPVTPTQAISNESVKSFTHPTAGYSVQHPNDWNEHIADIPTQHFARFNDFEIESPDYQLGELGIASGATIVIAVNKTTFTNVEDEFNNDTLMSEIARNKTNTLVDGNNAIKFDFSYEWATGTHTLFIKDGLLYRIIFRYADEQVKTRHLETYEMLLSSLKTAAFINEEYVSCISDTLTSIKDNPSLNTEKLSVVFYSTPSSELVNNLAQLHDLEVVQVYNDPNVVYRVDKESAAAVKCKLIIADEVKGVVFIDNVVVY